jgi:hypothetical protein
MKKTTLIAVFTLIMCGSMLAQQEKGITGYDNWLNPWAEFKPNKMDYGEPTQILSGHINKNTILRKKDIYLLLGDVFVSGGSTLTIEPGTVIIGDYKTKGALIITKDSKIVAEGTATDPIVFTSSKSVKKAGDWGGLFILGGAPTNQISNASTLNYGLQPSEPNSLVFGGTNGDSSSGILKYIRIEFAGKRTKDYGHLSALTLAGVGQQTIIENIMVSYSGGNAFNVLGGKLILDQMVSYRSTGNDYKFNNGSQVWFTNSLAIRSPYISSADISRSIYVSDYDIKDEVDFSKAQTFIAASNLTLVNLSSNLKEDVNLGLVNEAIYLDKDITFSLDMSVISGFNPAVIIDNEVVINNETLQKMKFTSTYFNNCEGNIFRKGFSNNEDLENWYGSRSFDNVYSSGPDSETFIDANNSKNPDFRLRINRIIASNDLYDNEDENDD